MDQVSPATEKIVKPVKSISQPHLQLQFKIPSQHILVIQATLYTTI